MKKKPHIVLDLDQTLISSEPVDAFDINNESKKKLFKYSVMENHYYVFERPGLQKFLKFLFKNFRVSIWTAASKDYGLFIVENIILANKPERNIEWFFYSYHCDISQTLKKSIKNLTVLNEIFKIRDFDDDTFIFDDNEEVYETQPKRCIIAKPFIFTDENSENDNYLEKVMEQLKSGKKISSINRNLIYLK